MSNKVGFIDTNNVLQPKTQDIYTATEDCAVVYDIVCNTSSTSLLLNGIIIAKGYCDHTSRFSGVLFITKGDVISISNKNHDDTAFTVYGLK